MACQLGIMLADVQLVGTLCNMFAIHKGVDVVCFEHPTVKYFTVMALISI